MWIYSFGDDTKRCFIIAGEFLMKFLTNDLYHNFNSSSELILYCFFQ